MIERKSKAIAAQRPRILFVDDDPIVIKAMRSLLDKAGFEPVCCATAEDAMSKAQSSIDAAVLDIHLPDENGLELSQRMRATHGPDFPIIILSGDNSMETIRALPTAGATYFFSKPVNPPILIEQLRDLTSRSGASEQV
jgi:DNA-binding response OmpR family regulator